MRQFQNLRQDQLPYATSKSLLPMIRVAGQKVVNLESIVRSTVNAEFPAAFNREMTAAIRTAR